MEIDRTFDGAWYHSRVRTGKLRVDFETADKLKSAEGFALTESSSPRRRRRLAKGKGRLEWDLTEVDN